MGSRSPFNGFLAGVNLGLGSGCSGPFGSPWALSGVCFLVAP